MTSAELKHQSRLQEWATAIQDCRSSGQSVKQWCRERGVTTATYYRWEREVLSIASATPELHEPTSPVRQIRFAFCASIINALPIELLSLGFTAFYHRVRDLQAIFSKI